MSLSHIYRNITLTQQAFFTNLNVPITTIKRGKLLPSTTLLLCDKVVVN